MKKIFITIGLSAALMASFTGCKKELEEKYNNPEQTSKASISAFFTTMLNNDRVRPKYWNARTFLFLHPSLYTQTAFFYNTQNAYQQNDGYTEGYWDDFYSSASNSSGVMGLYKAIEVAYNQLDEEDKVGQEIFMQAAKVVVYDQAAKMVDLWGDIPFENVGSLLVSSSIEPAKYDDQKELYYSFIAGLKDCASYFDQAVSTPEFAKQDILNKGNVGKWQAYANSLRLRLLLRISNLDEAYAKEQVLEMLHNPAQYPLVDGNNAGDYSPATSDVLLEPLKDATETLQDALTEGSYFAPDYMLNTLMLPSNDPRIPVIFDKYGRTTNNVFVPNKTYRAMPITFTTAEQERNYPEYSVVDSATFLLNPYLPGIVMTASEVNLLKAEAYERWGSSSEAASSYETGIKQSIVFYFYLNHLNTTGNAKTEVDPQPVVVDDFVKKSTIAYAGDRTEKLIKIWNQKWLHFGFLQSIEAWAELRRTGYPELTFPTEGKLSNYRTTPARLTYPAGERTNNPNYPAVQPKDRRDEKIFWDVN